MQVYIAKCCVKLYNTVCHGNVDMGMRIGYECMTVCWKSLDEITNLASKAIAELQGNAISTAEGRTISFPPVLFLKSWEVNIDNLRYRSHIFT